MALACPTDSREKDIAQEWQEGVKEEAIVCTNMVQEDASVSGQVQGEEGAEEQHMGSEDEVNRGSVGRGSGVLEVNPELRWELTQAVGYRLAKKRTIMAVGLLARAELMKTGLTEEMKARETFRSYEKEKLGM